MLPAVRTGRNDRPAQEADQGPGGYGDSLIPGVGLGRAGGYGSGAVKSYNGKVAPIVGLRVDPGGSVSKYEK